MSQKISSWSGRRLALFFSLGLILLSTAQVILRYTIPTDGWTSFTEDVENSNFAVEINLVGIESGLQPYDQVTAINGTDVSGSQIVYIPPPEGWQAGSEVEYRVLRCADPGRVHSADCTELSVPVTVVHWTPDAIRRYVGNLDFLSSFIGALLLAAVCWFAYLKRPEDASAGALLVFGSAILANVISGVVPVGPYIFFNPIVIWATWFFSFVIFGTVFAPSLLTFTLLFPRPKQAVQNRPWLAAIPSGLSLVLLVVLALGGPGALGWFFTLGSLLLSLLSLVHTWMTQRDPVSRAQLRWALTGFAAGMLLFSINIPLGLGWLNDVKLNEFWIFLLVFLPNQGLGVIGAGLAFAILKYRLYDIDVIIRRTLQYSIVTGLLAFVYFGVVVLLQTFVRQVTGEDYSPLVTVISTLTIAGLFNPLRTRIQHFVDRRFYRAKFDMELTLDLFSQTARDEVDLQNLTAALLDLVEGTMRPENASLWLKEIPGRNKP